MIKSTFRASMVLAVVLTVGFVGGGVGRSTRDANGARNRPGLYDG